MQPGEEHKRLAILQKQWSAEAMRDYKYNTGRYRYHLRHGDRILAKGDKQEALLDLQFAKWRMHQAESEERKSKRSH